MTGNLKESLYSKGNFKYEEALPYKISKITNNYELERFIYTGNLVELEEDRRVYYIQDKIKRNRR